MKKLLLAILCITTLSHCSSQTNNRRETLANTKNSYLHKVVEGEDDGWSSPCGYANKKGEIVIPMGKYKYCFTDTLKHFAVVMDQDNVCKAIDKSGAILYEVKWYDNGPDFVSDGLFRIIINGKTGYANEDGQIVIPAKYACTNPFEDGKASVTLTCELIKEGEYTRMESKEWFYIDKTGKRIED